MVWRFCQLLLIVGILFSVVVAVAIIGGLGLGTVAVVEAVMPKAPVATIYLSSPDDTGWKSEMILSAGLKTAVIIQPVPDNVRRIELRYQIPLSGVQSQRVICDSHDDPPKHGELFPARWEELDRSGSILYQVVPVVLPGRGNKKEYYATNFKLQFCGWDDIMFTPSRREYFLGLWYGPKDRAPQAAAEVKGVTVDSLRPTAH